jgi:hypothetical protein
MPSRASGDQGRPVAPRRLRRLIEGRYFWLLLTSYSTSRAAKARPARAQLKVGAEPTRAKERTT